MQAARILLIAHVGLAMAAVAPARAADSFYLSCKVSGTVWAVAEPAQARAIALARTFEINFGARSAARVDVQEQDAFTFRFSDEELILNKHTNDFGESWIISRRSGAANYKFESFKGYQLTRSAVGTCQRTSSPQRPF